MGKGGVGKDGGKAKPLKQAKKGPKEYDEARHKLPVALTCCSWRRGPLPSEAVLPPTRAPAVVCRL